MSHDGRPALASSQIIFLEATIEEYKAQKEKLHADLEASREENRGFYKLYSDIEAEALLSIHAVQRDLPLLDRLNSTFSALCSARGYAEAEAIALRAQLTHYKQKCSTLSDALESIENEKEFS